MASSSSGNGKPDAPCSGRVLGPPEPPGGHMPLEQRTKIFIPFEPLKGFAEAIREKERQLEAAHPQMHAFRKSEGGASAEEAAS